MGLLGWGSEGSDGDGKISFGRVGAGGMEMWVGGGGAA
jgi:hypothetical protein